MITIKREWNDEKQQVDFKAEYKGAGGVRWAWGQTISVAFRILCSHEEVSAYIFADTLVAEQMDIRGGVSRSFIEITKELNSTIRRLRKELRGLR